MNFSCSILNVDLDLQANWCAIFPSRSFQLKFTRKPPKMKPRTKLFVTCHFYTTLQNFLIYMLHSSLCSGVSWKSQKSDSAYWYDLTHVLQFLSEIEIQKVWFIPDFSEKLKQRKFRTMAFMKNQIDFLKYFPIFIIQNLGNWETKSLIFYRF